MELREQKELMKLRKQELMELREQELRVKTGFLQKCRQEREFIDDIPRSAFRGASNVPVGAAGAVGGSVALAAMGASATGVAESVVSIVPRQQPQANQQQPRCERFDGNKGMTSLWNNRSSMLHVLVSPIC